MLSEDQVRRIIRDELARFNNDRQKSIAIQNYNMAILIGTVIHAPDKLPSLEQFLGSIKK